MNHQSIQNLSLVLGAHGRHISLMFLTIIDMKVIIVFLSPVICHHECFISIWLTVFERCPLCQSCQAWAERVWYIICSFHHSEFLCIRPSAKISEWACVLGYTTCDGGQGDGRSLLLTHWSSEKVIVIVKICNFHIHFYNKKTKQKKHIISSSGIIRSQWVNMMLTKSWSVFSFLLTNDSSWNFCWFFSLFFFSIIPQFKQNCIIILEVLCVILIKPQNSKLWFLFQMAMSPIMPHTPQSVTPPYTTV